MKDFESYKNRLNQQENHKKQNSKHIINEKDYSAFGGFNEWEIWGAFADYDYENWLKEQ